MELKKLQQLVSEEYKKNGYEILWTATPEKQKVYDIAELGLITTEVSEAIEAIRKKQYGYERLKVELGFECSDIIIRTLNFCSRNNINVEEFILKKHNINLTRGIFHGKNI